MTGKKKTKKYDKDAEEDQWVDPGAGCRSLTGTFRVLVVNGLFLQISKTT